MPTFRGKPFQFFPVFGGANVLHRVFPHTATSQKRGKIGDVVRRPLSANKPDGKCAGLELKAVSKTRPGCSHAAATFCAAGSHPSIGWTSHI